ncbi:MAG: DUF5110 domain-containing protein [Porphyromonadaceae bacterium]|nr:DUF5110 domain-containing protein [Porphyromonadaceae bacterium]
MKKHLFPLLFFWIGVAFPFPMIAENPSVIAESTFATAETPSSTAKASAFKSYKRTSDGLLLTLTPSADTLPTKVRLQVIDERIIRVTAIPRGNFPTTKSLSVLPQTTGTTPFTVQESADSLTLATAAVRLSVNKSTGALTFADADGNIRLQERVGGGTTFRPITVDGVSAYSYRVQFDSPADESFYGLGQHPSDEFDYKGRNESLYQYNTKVSLPFIYSTRGYGLLFDTYSLCKWGDRRDYAPLDEALDLFDAEGNPGALTAVYTPSEKKKEVAPLTRRESRIGYEDQLGILDLPEGFPLDGATVVYTGELAARESGDYRFLLYYAGYIKVYIDGELVVPERWRTAWNPNSYKFTLPLEAGCRHAVRLEWRPDGGVSYLALRALTPVDEVEQGRLSWYSEMASSLDYYYIAGDSADAVISGYRRLTGKAPIMPRWAMGLWQSRERYKTQAELLATVAEFRRRQIPLDNIVLDWNYWPEDAWGSHEFDPVAFPRPAAMVDSVHALNARLMISVWPKFYTTTDHYAEFARKGWLYTQSVKDSLRDWVGKGYLYAFYDAYAPGARCLFWNQMKEHLFPLGIDAWWMDASEPNVRDCTDMEYRKALCGPTALGPSTQYFNAYALMNAEAIYDGQRAADPDRRVFLLTRSGFAGLQRYATATWSGDIASRWEDLKAQIPAALNFSVSGIPYWSMDIGGFCVERRYETAFKRFLSGGGENDDLREWRELNVRWYQFGAFVPLFRVHGQYPYREIWNIAPEGHPAYAAIAAAIRLRYALLPYIYSLAGHTWLDDYTPMRPLVMDFPTDLSLRKVDDEYMFGPAFLVCPVYTYGARTRTVRLPEGGWYDFYTGAYLTGGRTCTVPAPYERMPLFVRAGSIVPFGRELQYSSQYPADTLTVALYTGRDAAFTLYEDEGTRYDYERGEYLLIPMRYDEASRTLTVEAQQGGYEGMPLRRTLRIRVISPDTPIPCTDEETLRCTVVYTGEELVIPL